MCVWMLYVVVGMRIEEKDRREKQCSLFILILHYQTVETTETKQKPNKHDTKECLVFISCVSRPQREESYVKT